MEQNSIERQVLEWIAKDDHGISSMTMAYAAMGMADKLEDCFHPLDIGDLGRCVRLVDQIEGIKSGFGVLRGMSVQWCNVIDHWDELVELYNHENASDDTNIAMRMPETRALLKKQFDTQDTISE